MQPSERPESHESERVSRADRRVPRCILIARLRARMWTYLRACPREKYDTRRFEMDEEQLHAYRRTMRRASRIVPPGRYSWFDFVFKIVLGAISRCRSVTLLQDRWNLKIAPMTRSNCKTILKIKSDYEYRSLEFSKQEIGHRSPLFKLPMLCFVKTTLFKLI